MDEKKKHQKLSITAPYQRAAAQVLEDLDVTLQQGLSEEQVAAHRESYGENAFSREKPESFLHRVWDAAREPMIIMLILAAFITLGVNVARAFTGGEADFLECVGIFVAISLSVVITVIMEGRSAKAFEALSQITQDNEIRVIRGGKAQMTAQKDIVVGDILCIAAGDKMPADARLVEDTALMADESALTGESMPVHKQSSAVFDSSETPVAERTNMLYSGSFITAGNGTAVVTAVGSDTEFGKIARELSSTVKSTTPLQEKMASLGKRITVLGASAAAVVFLLQLALFIYRGTASLDTVSDAFITSIVLIVAAVPEGLPTIVAVSLAIDIIKMSKQNALVKKLIACETIGCINVVCSDKTGTLTENRMTVTDVYEEQSGLCRPAQLKSTVLFQNFCVNSTADIGCSADTEGDRQSFIGNPTECALLAAVGKAGLDYRAVRGQARISHVFPFCSEQKNMTTILREPEGYCAYTKGSPEKILSMCRMDPDHRQEVERLIAGYQEKACRVIGFAHGELEEEMDWESERSRIESQLQFDGFVAITDPLRADVYQSVKRCREAGIELKMLTGDNLVTATAIANELHLLDEGHSAVEAGVIEKMSDEELAERLPSIRVIARSTPVVKMRVVNALKSRQYVVAVTGDGINDAPAIKNADVGIAMGISGTDVSKEASDIVLLDDSFSTIVKAVQWGRGIYENFQRFIQFQLTVNLSSVIVVLASILSGFEAPFTALQLLWINIIMDGPPALTLGLEPIRSDLMNQQPTRRNASIVSRSMLSRIVINGLFISAIFMAQHWTNFMGGTREQQPTILFTLFVVFQLFNAFNSRELGNASVFSNIAGNRLMLGVFTLTFALQVLITQVGGAMFGTVPLPPVMWAKIVGLGLTVVIASEAAKLVKTGLAAARVCPKATHSHIQSTE